MDPRSIILTETGLDVNYANEGMWVKGIYFSENASYSCPGYSYAVPNRQNVFEVLLCEVILGDSIDLAIDAKYK